MTNINEQGFIAQRLQHILTALEYTRATIGRQPNSVADHPGYVEIHGGRAFQSVAYLDLAIEAAKDIRRITNAED